VLAVERLPGHERTWPPVLPSPRRDRAVGRATRPVLRLRLQGWPAAWGSLGPAGRGGPLPAGGSGGVNRELKAGPCRSPLASHLDTLRCARRRIVGVLIWAATVVLPGPGGKPALPPAQLLSEFPG